MRSKVLFGATAIGASMIAFATVTLAQEGVDPAHPAHIHTGTCESPGDVVVPLSDVSAPQIDPSLPLEISQTRWDDHLRDVIHDALPDSGQR